MVTTQRLKQLRETLRKLRDSSEAIGDYPGLVKLAKSALEDVSALMQEAEEREEERCKLTDCVFDRDHAGPCQPF